MNTTMQRKINSMHYLIIEINVILVFRSLGCEPKSRVEYNVKAKWIFINQTDYKITYLPNYLKYSTFILEPHDTVIYIEDGEGPKDITEKNYVPPLNPEVILYNTILCDTLQKNEGPMNLENYNSRKLDERYYEFTYVFNSKDINRADTCR